MVTTAAPIDARLRRSQLIYVCLYSLIAAATLLSPLVARAQSSLPFDDDPEIIHITDRLNGLEISRKALRDFGAAQNAVDRGLGKRVRAFHEVGDTRAFKVYNHISTRQKGRFVLDVREFTAVAVHDRFVVWAESSELENGHIREADVEDLVAAMARRTPESSIDPNSGILAIDQRFFGMPADVDNDGAVNVLLVDIRDGWEPGSNVGYIAGFVWAGDLTKTGNESDIVYVDTFPGLYRSGGHVGTTGLEATLAHEYLHLIHLNHDPNELTFVDEGLAEWASELNGYAARHITYLDDADEHNNSLFNWRSGAGVRNDYERAGLFTSYLAQRIGPVATGRILQQNSGLTPLQGADGYESALASANLSLSEVLADFHLANFLNNPEVDGSLGYMVESRRAVRADPTYKYDASVAGVTSIRDFPLNPGAVQYFQWTGVSRLELKVDVNPTSIADPLIPIQRRRISARLIVENSDGSVSIKPVALGPDGTVVDHSAARVSFVLVHHAPGEYGVRVDVDASWSEGTAGVGRDADELPTRLVLEQNYPNPFNPRTTVRYMLMEPGHTRLTVFDGLGRLVERVVDGHRRAGVYEVVLDASEWPSGTYVYTLHVNGLLRVRKMTVLR